MTLEKQKKKPNTRSLARNVHLRACVRRAVCNYYKLTCSFAFEVYCTHAALQACTVRCGAMSAQTNTFARSGRRAMINWTNLSPKVWLKLCAFLFVARWQYRYTNRETMLLRNSPQTPPPHCGYQFVLASFLHLRQTAPPTQTTTTKTSRVIMHLSCYLVRVGARFFLAPFAFLLWPTKATPFAFFMHVFTRYKSNQFNKS